ncbi:hypothetical protein [Stackebrandtia nassauensis]|uniref:Uncharacterized protein n=1 Tax=Stackebrandtia nassauensis (strain DSM 44728 / CIP 108903 / NRRL B-16338 / NBRC 102104 / LLR-40K-21) TaxID=446470 RepID=D3Q2W8_STANL|nr:hypothetical protein [Stackebrandtia nassauensis]ADD45869.1 hypothetical protein Snas_6249 [Stackebrandtia nassauensis DSM 44728]
MSNVVDPNNLSGDELVAALRRCANRPNQQAAIQLLVSHGHLLDRADVRREFVMAEEHDGVVYAWMHWAPIEDTRLPVPLSSGEAALLRIAASIGDFGIDVNLANTITSLDTPNTRRVLAAIAHAAGKDRLVSWS